MPNVTIARGTTLQGSRTDTGLPRTPMDFDSRDLLEIGTRNGVPILAFWQQLVGCVAVSTVLGEGTIVAARHNRFVPGQVTVDLMFAGREIGLEPASLGPPTVRTLRVPEGPVAESICLELEAFRRARLEASLERERAEQARKDQLAREAAERERAREEAQARERAELNANRQFDLVLFDLDDTLVESSHLERFRGRDHVGKDDPAHLQELSVEVTTLRQLIDAAALQRLKEVSPEIKLGVFTRAPKVYAHTVLSACFPEIEWNVVIAYDDVRETKPSPEGIITAARRAGVPNHKRVLLVGDDSTDIAAAYQAGCSAALATAGWGSGWKTRDHPKRTDCYRARDWIPDALMQGSSELEAVVFRPWTRLPALEARDTVEELGLERLDKLEVRTINHFEPREMGDGTPRWVTVSVMGRYFSANSSRYDFSRKSKTHGLTRRMLEFKDGHPLSETWIECCAEFVRQRVRDLSEMTDLGFWLTVIPARPGRPPRLESFLERLVEHLGDTGGDVRAVPDALRFKPGARSNSKDRLSERERFENIRDHLEWAGRPFPERTGVVVFDDVVTSGASLFYADRLFKQAGAFSVIPVALAQAIS